MSYLSTFLKEYAKEVGETLIDLGMDALSSRCQKGIFRRAPRNPFLLGRMWDKHKLPHDSVASRQSELPPTGMAGVRAKRILVFHMADKAGPHLEAYLSIDGQAYNIGVKRLSPEILADLGIRRNGGGWLTNVSQEKLMKFWASEFVLNETRWLAQTTNHTEAEARMSWSSHDSGVEGYGAGDLRQVLNEVDVAVNTTGNSVEFVDSMIDRHRKVFVFKVMDKKDSVRPRNILGLGRKENPEPPHVEKLKLKLRTDPEKFYDDVGHDGLITIKEDGASVKFRINNKGSLFWSPRVSKVTKAHIMYDSKVRDWVGIRSSVPIEGMGEFLAFQQKPLPPSIFSQWFINLIPKPTWQLSAAEIGGLLNSNYPIPDNIKIQLVIYLISKEGRQNVAAEPWQFNRERVLRVSELHKDWGPSLQVNDPAAPEFSRIMMNVYLEDAEGYVGVRNGDSVLQGYKLKVRGDSLDGVIEKVAFEPGPTGKVAGVVWYKDTETNRLHKTSSGFTEAEKTDMMMCPDDYEGRVMVLDHFAGHRSRAAKFSHFHADKGMAI